MGVPAIGLTSVIMGRGVAGAATAKVANSRGAGVSGTAVGASGRSNSMAICAQVRIGDLIAIEAGGMHLLEPMQLAARLFHGEDDAIHLVLAFELQPLVVLVLGEIGGQHPREALDALLRRPSRAPESGAAAFRR